MYRQKSRILKGNRAVLAALYLRPQAMETSRSQGTGRLAGAIWLAGAVTLIPISLALGAALGPTLGTAVAAGLAGAVCFAVPWGSLGEGWLHAPGILGSIAVAVAVASAGPDSAAYAWLLCGVAIYAALAFETRPAIGGQIGFALAALTLASLAGESTAGVATVLGAAPALVAIAATVAIQRERLETHSQRDPLTGVGNYRVLGERLRYEIVRHERHRRAFSVMLLDLDRFKLVNDRYGHLEGDRLLRAVARAMLKSVRDQDTVARQGGDEFSALLPETGDQGAAIVASKIDAALGQIVIAGTPVRASIGWAVFPQDGQTPETLLAVADERQRAAKDAGRRSRQGAAGIGGDQRVAA